MAEVEKFTNAGIMMLLKHSERQLTNDSNKQIVESKKDLNYSMEIDTGELTQREYYKQLVDTSYLYGRGTKRESTAVTACSWVVTLPKEISDYTKVGKDEIIRLHPKEEYVFFKGAFDFINARYPGCVFHNKVHYDEGGQPHIHIYFVPRLELNHEQIQYKTINTHNAYKTQSGRYEYEYKFKLENGQKIPLKNYAKASDSFDYKISGADILNKAELQHFHGDFAAYLQENNLPGANAVYTGKTGEKNISVKALKEFTLTTGFKIDELRQHPLHPDQLKALLEQTNIKSVEKKIIESINKDAIIIHLKEELADIKEAYKLKDLQLQQSQAKVKELEARQQDINTTHQTSRWGASPEWGRQSGWGSKSNTIHIGEEN